MGGLAHDTGDRYPEEVSELAVSLVLEHARAITRRSGRRLSRSPASAACLRRRGSHDGLGVYSGIQAAIEHLLRRFMRAPFPLPATSTSNGLQNIHRLHSHHS